MQIIRRPLAPGETDHEFLWFAVSLGGFGFAAIWFALHLPWPICLFHELTGHPCLTCGATRSAIAFFHAHFFTAWKWNPLALAGYCAISVFDVYAFVTLITSAPRLRIVNLTVAEKNSVRAAVVASFAFNWIYLLSHSRQFA